mmetsp:Transcript_6948/g.21135  ORF Transcript_6948/g.21135 Transcript_6948/m.21135 type:complete len:131 (-) Transcript_6948:1866-2258(-)
MGELTETQYHQLHVTMLVCGGLSFVLSLLVMIFHVCLSKSRRRFNDPVFWLSFCCTMAPLFTLEFGRWGKEFCVMEGMGNQFFNVASFFWVTCIAHQLYQVICCELPIESGKYMMSYHLLGWVRSGLTSA